MKIKLLFWIIFLLNNIAAFAIDNMASGKTNNFIQISESTFYILEDDKQIFSFEDILKKQNQFKPFKDFKDGSTPNKCVWGRFQVRF